MSQSKRESLIETTANTAIGYIIALASQLVVFPLVGIHISFSTNMEISAYFTAVSVARGYLIRRWFNARIKRLATKLAKGSRGA